MVNGVDVSKFCPQQSVRERTRARMKVQDEFVWLAVGRLERAKDYPCMLKAFAEVLHKQGSARLMIVGEGRLRTDVQELVLALGLGCSIRLLGLRNDVPELMTASDAFVMSSAWEGMPLVLLEAAASGLPIVATDVGSNSEIVLDGKNGLIVPPGNPDLLAQAMLRIMDQSLEDRKRMGATSRSHAERFYNIDTIVERWENTYHELLLRKHLRTSARTLNLPM
jgi:glycosyltransferase involved in cell wall biosynthesis